MLKWLQLPPTIIYKAQLFSLLPDPMLYWKHQFNNIDISQHADQNFSSLCVLLSSKSMSVFLGVYDGRTLLPSTKKLLSPEMWGYLSFPTPYVCPYLSTVPLYYFIIVILLHKHILNIFQSLFLILVQISLAVIIHRHMYILISDCYHTSCHKFRSWKKHKFLFT